MADIIRELFDVFMMPVVFFISGYFALPSIGRRYNMSLVFERGYRKAILLLS
jgi:fucose 4-O-acetylase-like acetyltransferase